MSAVPPEQSMTPWPNDTDRGVFQAIVVTDERSTVLAELTEQAVNHFGHGRLRVSNVSVTAVDHAAVLASADFVDLSFLV